jgi:glycosyltransferase involved in cell wall biosynthesis
MQSVTEQYPFGPPTQQTRRSASVFLMNSDLSTGGTERQFSLLAKAMRNGPFELHLGCMRRRGAFLEGIGDISEFDVHGNFLSRQAQHARQALKQQLRQQDVAIAHSFDFYSNLMLLPVARWARIPVVIGSHRQLGDLLGPLQWLALCSTFRLCTRVVCNSQAAALRLSNAGLSDSKIVVIPNGLPEEAFVGCEPVSGQEAAAVRIGLIARMNHLCKNQDVYLQAAERLAGRFPEAEFVLVGDGPYRSYFERLAEKLRIGHQVKFLGERRDIPRVLATIDISVVCSSSESLSNVIMESMAAGKPVIATRVGGNAELVQEGKTGLLVPPRDVEALVGALEKLLTKPHCRKDMGQAAQRLARRDFCIDRIRAKYEELYASLLKEKGWGHSQRLAVPGEQKVSKPALVAIVAPSLRKVGGMAVQADLLWRHWQEDPEFGATFVPTDPALPPGLKWVERIPYLRTIVRTPFYVFTLWRGIARAETVHIFAASYWSFLLGPVPAWLVAAVQGKRSLINYRSGEAPDHLRRSSAARSVLRRVDRLIVPSRYLVDVFLEHNLTASAIPNIVDLAQFSYRARNPLRSRLVCTRMFESYYQVDVVVRAFAEVVKAFPDARLCLVGAGSQEKELRMLAAEANLHNIEFAGAVSRSQIGHYYDEADIFINASRLDNMPVSILEAFASGTPVVTTAPAGMRYFVEHERTGLLCVPGDWRALAANVVRLLQQPMLAMRLAESAYVESKSYRWEAVRSQWLAVYSSLLPLGSRLQTVTPDFPAAKPREIAPESRSREHIKGQG